jgi:hypothetical protein
VTFRSRNFSTSQKIGIGGSEAAAQEGGEFAAVLGDGLAEGGGISDATNPARPLASRRHWLREAEKTARELGWPYDAWPPPFPCWVWPPGL